MKPRAIQVRLLPAGVVFEVRPEESVLEAALRQKIDIPTSCGGMGTCTACRAFVESTDAELPERNEVEAEITSDRGFAANERLTCQLIPLGNLTLRLP